MQIVELGDCSMVIMKDSEDPPWITVGYAFRKAESIHGSIRVTPVDPADHRELVASEYICSGGRLILFFKEDIGDLFNLHEKVDLQVLGTRRSKRR